MPDGNRLMTAVDTSIYAQPAQQNALAQIAGIAGAARQVTAAQSDQFDLARRHLGAMNDAFSSIVTDPTPDNLQRRAADLAAVGVPQEAIDRGLAEFNAYGGDPAAIKRIAARHLSEVSTIQQRMEQAGMGAPSLVDNGKEKFGVVARSGLNPGISVAGGPALPNKLTPQDRVRTQDSVDTSTGAPSKTPLGELYDDKGNLRRIPVYRGGAGSGGAGPASDGASAPGGSSTAPASPQAAAAASGSFSTGLSPSRAADIDASAKEFTSARDDLTPGQDRIFGLQQAIGALRGTNTGLGTDGRQKLANYINALPGGVGKQLVPDSSALSDYDLANKYLTAYQMNRPGAGRSDAALRTSSASSPNTSMTKPAAIETALNLLGQEQMRQAQVKDYIARGGDPGQFANVRSQEYGQSNDPKAFALGSMTPDERAKYASSLNGAAKARFLGGVRLGLKTGVLNRDDLTGASNGQ